MKHNNLYLATYNVRSLSSHERLLELDTALKRIKFDVIGLSETKRLGNSIEEYRNFILFYIGQTPGLHGVGFIVKKYLKENILNFNGLSERVAILNLSFDKLKLSIIQVYAPTEAAPDEDIKEFYKTLNTALSMSNRNVIVMGDFNAKIGQAKSGENSIIKYGYGTRNGRGEMLIEFAFENNLPILNTFFKKKDKRKWTWRSPDGSTKNEIDFILSNLKGNVTNIEVIDLPFSSDHRQVRATLQLQTAHKKSRKNYGNQPKSSLLQDDEIKTYLELLNTSINNLMIINENTFQTFYDKLIHAITTSQQLAYNPANQSKNKIINDLLIQPFTWENTSSHRLGNLH
ncbi:craniofacial development protein 2-like [Bicyclus anynana]|uniref:Craniofacial development protein 2-like n=1 Tax=Bicyclus anynana TaxID=110368 RepID=A0ABM3LPU0_BICAN|nr:craniofacial development protein 2-like [Bicyclus anynana]